MDRSASARPLRWSLTFGRGFDPHPAQRLGVGLTPPHETAVVP